MRSEKLRKLEVKGSIVTTDEVHMSCVISRADKRFGNCYLKTVRYSVGTVILSSSEY